MLYRPSCRARLACLSLLLATLSVAAPEAAGSAGAANAPHTTRQWVGQLVSNVWHGLGRAWQTLLGNAPAQEAPTAEDGAALRGFAAVGGLDEAKAELAEVLAGLESPERFTALGITPPRGVLLSGPPGSGKTLLVRALAEEANATFFLLTASELRNPYIGQGGIIVRDLFAQARAAAPSVVFLDELDAIGQTRSTGVSGGGGGGSGERASTLNALLGAMDGVIGRGDVVVIGATNLPNLLDPALTRPGRLERHIQLGLPNRADRLAVLRLHAANKRLADDVDLARVAEDTDEVSNAALASIVNEAALLAFRERKDAIAQEHFARATWRVLLGVDGATRQLGQAAERRVAVHEVGHAAMHLLLPGSKRLIDVSLGGVGAVLGANRLGAPAEPVDGLYTEALFKNDLVAAMGGRAAETVLLGSASSGAAGDLAKATHIAYDMVTELGFGAQPSLVSLNALRDQAHGQPMSEPRLVAVEEAITRLLQESHETALSLVEAHRAGLLRAADGLIAKRQLTAAEVAELADIAPAPWWAPPPANENEASSEATPL